MIAGVKFADDEDELRNLIDCRSLLQSRSIDRLRAIFGKCLGALSVMPDFTNRESSRAGSRVPDMILPEWERGQIGGDLRHPRMPIAADCLWEQERPHLGAMQIVTDRPAPGWIAILPGNDERGSRHAIRTMLHGLHSGARQGPLPSWQWVYSSVGRAADS